MNNRLQHIQEERSMNDHTQPRGALEAAVAAGRSIVSELTELNLMRVSGSYSYEDLLTAVNGAQQNAQHFCETHLPALLSAGAEGESDNHPEKITMSQLPEHDTSKPKNEQGLYRKFEVNRTDGSDAPGGKHHGCEYFVLDTTHDKFAAPALLAYANACESEYPELAADLRKRYMLAAQEGVNMTAQRRRSSDV